MSVPKDKKTNKELPTLTKNDFLRVLDRAINPPKSPDQEINKTLEKPDFDCCNEKRTHLDSVEGT